MVVVPSGAEMLRCSPFPFQTPDELRRKGEGIMSCIGESVQVQEEKYLDMATAISGSGPAVRGGKRVAGEGVEGGWHRVASGTARHWPPSSRIPYHVCAALAPNISN
jgi:hypothetical protein